ncbi:YccT family protein [Vibrio nigripulchritudo]|uniref:YccT family protein n=1 Tax=Vibrio nigripulchritudo TaxID=28173 RepID=UPI00249062DA|nr:DUF2057 domain-containing protein [Vibrio nigripulchritudo]BDU36348.1 UPF0319 protein [Vibrio nigripulchritudo]BDU42005.1 UPF0319 protein [Vibrio nigripulchritudo]
MKLSHKLLLTSALVPFASLADVEISIPKDVQLMIVNGEDIGYSSFGFDYKETLTIPNGTNQIVFRVAKVVTEAGSKNTKFKSQPLVATFTSSDSEIALTIPRINTLSQGERFNKDPKFYLKDSNGDLKSLKTGQIKVGFTFMPDMVQEVKNFNESSEPASIAAYTGKAIEVDTVKIEKKNVSAKKATTTDLETLQQLFNQASQDDRKAFLTWAISNMN